MSLPWLKVEGKWVVDESGNKVALRGVGGDYLNYAYGVKQSIIDKMKETGLNSWRMAFHWQPEIPTPFGASTFNFAKMDEQIRRLEAAGIYTILDAHYLGPDWADPAYLPTFIAEWVKVAEHYKNWSAVAAYELVGEPIGDPATIRNAYRQIIDAVRVVDPNHMIMIFDWITSERPFYETIQGWYQRCCWLPHANEVNRPNILYSLHTGSYYYSEEKYVNENFEETTKNFPLAECAASEGIYIISKYRDYVNAPVVAGENTCRNRNIANADMHGLKEFIRMCDEAGIPLTGIWSTDVPDFYDLNWLVPSPLPKYYSPRNVVYVPFNLFDHLVARGGPDYNVWGRHHEETPTRFILWGNGNSITLNGGATGISVKVRMIEVIGYFLDPANVREVPTITIPPNQNVTITVEGATPGLWVYIVYANELLGVKMLSVNSNPVIGAPITINGQKIGDTPLSIQLTEGTHLVSVPESIEAS